MQQTMITSVQGPIAANTLTELARLSRQAGAHWLTSKIIQLEGQFSALIKLEVEAHQLITLQQTLQNAMPQLAFHYHDIQAQAQQARRRQVVTLDCFDRQGLTHDIQALLMNVGANIEQLEHNRMMVASIGQTVYQAQITLTLCEGITNEELASALENISAGMRVTLA
ncbi:ACT domain-containing protein [Shewanella sp. NIFS-20-20]|uniref:ACT domain-containing protein n=1 Tax=Shewanella sp. NIFS-20-20 TaxID=2853806 RepID=UPI001C449A3D|nr:ACT domain-containing protein [Shewanella sp. NIFS-20-20]MBV7317075.1 hypothetical protein [Shewanella sp. NIFS-20-20]